MWVVLQIRVPFRVLSLRVSYDIGDPNRDPNIENYPVKHNTSPSAPASKGLPKL